MDWFAQAVLRQIVGRAARHQRLIEPAVWEGLDEPDVVDCVRDVLVGLGFGVWREWSYAGTKDKADVVTESAVPEEASVEWWIEAKRIYDRDVRLNRHRFDHGERDFVRDFERLHAGASGSDCLVVWAVYSDFDTLARAGATAAGSYSVQQAIDHIDLLFGCRPVVARSDMSKVVGAIGTSATQLHVLVWHFTPRALRRANAPTVAAAPPVGGG